MSKCWYCNNELTTGDSPKHFGICNKCYDEMFRSGDTIIRSLTNKIADLETKLSESEKKHLIDEKEWQDYCVFNHIEPQIKGCLDREKERYELFGEFGIIHDTSQNAECMLLNKFKTCEILNKQDKEIQQLKQQLKDLEESYNKTMRYLNNIRSELLNLPKKIVGDIEKNFTEYLPLKDKTGAWFYGKLNEILKKYGVEDE